MIIFPNQLFRNRKGGISFSTQNSLSAISLIQASGCQSNLFSLSSSFFPHVTQAGSTLVMALKWLGATGMALSSVSDGFNTYTIIPGTLCSGVSPNQVAPGMIGTQFAYCINALSVPTTSQVICTMEAGRSTQYSFVDVFELTKSTLDQSVTGTANQVTTALISAGSVTTANNGSFGIATLIVDDNVGAGSIGSAAPGWTMIQNLGGGSYEEGTEYMPQSTAGLISGNMVTLSKPQTWFGSMVTFKPA